MSVILYISAGPFVMLLYRSPLKLTGTIYLYTGSQEGHFDLKLLIYVSFASDNLEKKLEQEKSTCICVLIIYYGNQHSRVELENLWKSSVGPMDVLVHEFPSSSFEGEDTLNMKKYMAVLGLVRIC